MHVKQLESSVHSYTVKIEDAGIQEKGETSKWVDWVLRLIVKDVQ